MNRILIIDDEPTIRMLLCRMLELEGYEVFKAKDRASALEQLRRQPVQVVLCDVFLPDGNGVTMVPELQQVVPEAAIILLTAHGNIPDGVQAIKNGAFDYMVKGDDNRKIIPIVSRAMDSVQRNSKPVAGSHPGRQASTTLQEERQVGTFESMTALSACMQQVVSLARKVAATDVPVLLTGETGTGKEVFAHAIHQAGPRARKPFVAVNCSAFSRELLESELFGHIAGSFTGALHDKKGLFEEADGGTLFLDEIGEMTFDLQARLLRVLETGEFLKVGATRPTRTDVRILSATNRHLKDEITKGRFREDLYFRLSVFQLTLPPLRERKADIADLAQHFAMRLGKRLGVEQPAFSAESMALLERYNWPGNVRELQNVVERALIVCNGTITPADLPVEMVAAHTETEGTDTSTLDLHTLERNHIVRVLKYTGGNKTAAARLLKIGLTTLYRKIEEYGLAE